MGYDDAARSAHLSLPANIECRWNMAWNVPSRIDGCLVRFRSRVRILQMRPSRADPPARKSGALRRGSFGELGRAEAAVWRVENGFFVERTTGQVSEHGGGVQ